MTLKYEQSAEDYTDFNYYFLWSNPGKKHKRIINGLLPLSFFLLFIFLKRGFAISTYGPGEALVLGIGVLFLFIQDELVYRNCKRLVKKQVLSGKTVDVLSTRTITLQDDQLIEATPNTRSQIQWSAFEKIGETNKHFFLLFNGNQGIIVPKRAFHQAEEQNNFRSFVTEKINTTQL